MTAAATGSTTTAALTSIRVPEENVRERLDEEHVAALAKSIALQGLISPLTVMPSEHEGFTYDLVAGFHRYAALRKLGQNVAAITLRGEDDDQVDATADRATENILRKQLNPYEEALAVHAMLARGLTVEGTADALGWSTQRVRARTRLLSLPERIQQLIGAGTIPLSSVEQLHAIQAVEPKILDSIAKAIDEGHDYLGEALADRPGYVLDAVMRDHDSGLWFEWMNSVDRYDVERFKLGKHALADAEAIAEAQKEYQPYGGGGRVDFEDAEIDQARAAGVLIEFEGHRNRGIIVDRKLYRELCKQALKRGAAEAAERLAQHRAHKPAKAKADPGAPSDPLVQAKRIHREKTNQLADQAHGVNLELGRALLTGLEVSADDMDVARFFVYGLLGPDARKEHWQGAGERVARLASQGIRIVIEDFRTDVTKTKKDGSKGRMKIDYGDRAVDQFPEDAQRWLWKFLDGAKSADELYGRALMVIAAERYALSRIVLPAAQRHHPQHFGAHKDIAEKMLKKLTKDHVPPSLAALRRAIDRANNDLAKAEDDVRKARSAQPGHEQVGDINFPSDQDEDLAGDGE